MAKTSQVPLFVRIGNILTTTLLHGKRYLASPYGIVDWIRNLRTAGEAILTRGRRSETVNARELPTGEAALVLREGIKGGNPFARYYQVTAESSLEDFERAALHHPVFVLQPPLVQKRQEAPAVSQGEPQAEREALRPLLWGDTMRSSSRFLLTIGPGRLISQAGWALSLVRWR